MKIFKRAIVIVLIILFIILAIFAIYFADFYHAEAESYAFLSSSGDINVIDNGSYYCFDGPGNDYALIFYQGAKVEEEAYAKFLFKIAEQGIDSFLLKAPFNFAFFGKNKPEEIITNYSYKNYYLVGHSLRWSSCLYVLCR